MSQLIYLTQGKVSIINDERFHHIIALGPWHAQKEKKGKTYYACKGIWINNKRAVLFIHQAVWAHMGKIVPLGYELDHIDRDGLNNQDDNLRILTHRENIINRGLCKNNTSGVCGVDYYIKNNKYRLRYQENGQQRSRYFDTFEEAVAARLDWEKRNLPSYLQGNDR